MKKRKIVEKRDVSTLSKFDKDYEGLVELLKHKTIEELFPRACKRAYENLTKAGLL